MEYLKSTFDYYEKTGRKFAQKWGSSLLPSFNTLQMFATSIPGKRVLEVGFGLGLDALWFDKNGFSYTGIDPVKYFYRNLLEKLPNRDIRNEDIRKVSFKNNSFDGIYCNLSLLHLNDDDFKKSINKFHKWLRPRGVLFVSLKEGSGTEILEGRFFNYFTVNRFKDLCRKKYSVAGFIKKPASDFNTGSRDILSFYMRKIK